MTPLVDSDPILKNVITGVVVAVVVPGVVAGLGWLCGPLKWWWRNRRIKKLMLARSFVFVFNPANPSQQRKNVTFKRNGQIGDGQNNNEHSWRVRRGKLEIFGVDKKLYSRFELDEKTGRLVNTNDADSRSIRNQYIEAKWERAEVNTSR